MRGDDQGAEIISVIIIVVIVCGLCCCGLKKYRKYRQENSPEEIAARKAKWEARQKAQADAEHDRRLRDLEQGRFTTSSARDSNNVNTAGTPVRAQKPKKKYCTNPSCGNTYFANAPNTHCTGTQCHYPLVLR